MGGINGKILLALVFCSVTLAGLLGIIQLWGSSNALGREAEEKLAWMTECRAAKIEKEFSVIESNVKNLTGIIAGNLDPQLYGSDADYTQSLLRQIDPLVKGIAQTSPGISGAYFVSDPKAAAPLIGAGGPGPHIYCSRDPGEKAVCPAPGP